MERWKKIWGRCYSPSNFSALLSIKHNVTASLLQGAQAGQSCNNPRKPISTLISLMAKREVIWFIYNLVLPPLCWKPLMTWCLPTTGLRVFCQAAMMDYALGDLLWLSARQREQNERVVKRQGTIPICRACHLGSRTRFRKKKLKETLPSSSSHPSSPQRPSLQGSNSNTGHGSRAGSSGLYPLFRERRKISVPRSYHFQDCCSLITGKTDLILAYLLG